MERFHKPAGGRSRRLDLARVLVVHGELAPRLALQTILEAGGYAVETAATSSEAFEKLDEGRYALVLTDSCLQPRAATRHLLAYARMKDYRPATAMITLDGRGRGLSARDRREVAIRTEDLPLLLSNVAELIGLRASRRYRPLTQAV
jgi:CheY-like chemotaxis protein